MSSAPTPPDPYAVSAAQTQSNKDTAAYNASLNRVSQYTPYGNLVYSTTGTDPSTGAAQYRADVNLTPEAQKQLDNQLQQNDQISNIGFGLADKAQATLGNTVGAGLPSLQYGVNAGQINDGSGVTPGKIQSAVDTSGIPALPGKQDFNSTMQQAVNASYQKQAAFLDPQFANQRNDQAASLANQGINSASNPAAWERAQGDQSRNQEMAYGQARDQAISEGNTLQNNWTNQGIAENQVAATNALSQAQYASNAQNQDFQQQMAQALMQNQAQQQGYSQQMGQAGLNNATQAQGLQEQTALSTLPINQLDAIRSGTQIQNPTFGSVPSATANSTNVSGNVWNAYNAQVAASQANNPLGGLFGLGASILAAPMTGGGSVAGSIFGSDRRLKHKIRRIGTHRLGIARYEYSYLGSERRYIGLMAQDVAKVMPEAVHRLPSGFLAVDYGMTG